jgi:hypothetical protein
LTRLGGVYERFELLWILSDRLKFGLAMRRPPVRAVVVCGRGRNQQRNRLREVFQPLNNAVIRVYDEAGNVIETHEHAGEFKPW